MQYNGSSAPLSHAIEHSCPRSLLLYFILYAFVLHLVLIFINGHMTPLFFMLMEFMFLFSALVVIIADNFFFLSVAVA